MGIIELKKVKIKWKYLKSIGSERSLMGVTYIGI
jgi:hypothetical protein